MGKRELIALLNLSSWCLVMVEWLFLAVPRGCLQFVIVVFPDHTHLLFLYKIILVISQRQAHFRQFNGTHSIFLQVILMVTMLSLIKSKNLRLFDCLTYLN